MTFDTVVLIHAVNENSEFHAVCSRRIQDARDGPTAAFLTWNICYEFLRVTTHPNIMRPPLTSRAALRFITDLLNSPGFQILCPTSRHAEVLEQTLEELPWVRSNRFFDLHTAILMRENDVSGICTFDRGFRAFPFLNVIDPLA